MSKELNELWCVSPGDDSNELVDTLRSRGQNVILHLEEEKREKEEGEEEKGEKEEDG